MPRSQRFLGFAFDPRSATLIGPKGPVPLRPKALSLLELFLTNAGRTLGKEEILLAVWPGVTVGDETLTQTIHELRRALGDDAQAMIRTVPRRGYLFPSEVIEAPVQAGRSLAVSPFVNLSPASDQAFFAAGLALDLEAALGLIDGIEMRADGVAADMQLTGSVRSAADQIRVTARLVRTADGAQLWSGRFDGRTDDIFAFQDEITRQVAVAMQVNLTSGDYARLWDGQTRSLAAWERCVLANRYHERWTEADNRRARELLLEALEIDPDYIGAKVLLGKTWWYDARYYTDGPDRVRALDEAERLAGEVLTRHPASATATMMLGGVAWLRDRHDEAVALCRRASRLSPSDAWVTGFYGLISIFSGDLNEAMIVLDRAAQLSPQTLVWIHFHIAHGRAWAGNDAGAMASIQRYITACPQDCWGYLMLALIHGFADRKEAARLAVAEALIHKPDIDALEVSRANRYRDSARLKRVLDVLRAAGLPDRMDY